MTFQERAKIAAIKLSTQSSVTLQEAIEQVARLKNQKVKKKKKLRN